MKHEINPYPAIDEADALTELSDGGVLITASGHLASDWKRRLAEQTTAQVFLTPAVLSWSAWISELSRHVPDKVALTRLQEQHLWERIIARDLESHDANAFASVGGLARRVREAYALMREHQIASSELAMGGEESEALARWIAAMDKVLKSKALAQRMLSADVPAHLCSNIRDNTTSAQLPGRMLLDGFESFTSMQHCMLSALVQNGCVVLQVKDESPAATPVLTACADEAGEFRHVAARVHTLLEERPLARIAIVTSDFTADAPALRRALDAALIPEALPDPASGLQAVAMAGTPLSDMPMILRLLHLLSIAGQPRIGFADFSTLLLSPWLKGFNAEHIARARLDATFRQQNRHRLSWRALLKSSAVQALPLLALTVTALAEWGTGSRPASEWVKDVHGLLRSTGFILAGTEAETPRGNMEIRQMNAFRDVLSTLVAADAVIERMAWTQFLSMLRSACAEHRLALTPKYPNVVVMPLTQIAGLRFEHVIVTSLDEEAFPPPARPLPLLPPRVQQKHGLPMSSGSLAFESSRWLWDQLLCAAPVVEISYARQAGERELLPSSFATSLDEREPAEISAAPECYEIERFDDAPEVPVGEDESIRGGTAIIRNQSACPFRAFATHRLGISELGETTPGIEPTTKGSLIHQALEFIWQRLESQQALLDLGESERGDLINAAIAHAWKENKSSPDFDIQALEKKRMRGVLADWLALEAERPDFQVLQTEEKFGLSLPPDRKQRLSVRFVVDRLDQDATGRRILLDYKTGAIQGAGKWTGVRMEEPQLPLYALAAGLSAADAVAFANVRSGKDMGFEGLAAEDIGIAGLSACDGRHGRPEDFQTLLTEWKAHLNALAGELVDGRCDASPRDANACKYCTLKAVCRVEETGFDMGAGDEA